MQEQDKKDTISMCIASIDSETLLSISVELELAIESLNDILIF